MKQILVHCVMSDDPLTVCNSPGRVEKDSGECRAQTYILTRLHSCWYFISELPVPALKLLLPGKCFTDFYVLQCYIETCRDMWQCLDIWKCLNMQGAYRCPVSLTAMPASKVHYTL